MPNANRQTLRWTIPAAFLALALTACTTAAINTNRHGVAVDGYDVVAYFAQGKPARGSADHSLAWQGATWHFSTAANRAAFEAEPLRFAPQYGGYCAWAVAQNTTAGVDPPTAWKIVDGKLYLNYDRDIQKKWAADIPGNIAKADGNWPGVLQ